MASLAGTQIGKYDMIEEVGHGGMAVVYRGFDRVLKREVAVKVLHPHLADRKESRLRLEREAIAVAKLRHENILEIFDYSGPEAEASYIVTEFIHGVTLKDWVDQTLDPRPAVAALIVHRLCLALQHAHRTGIVHRDIKPENVMIREDGVLKLMDFGIAQIIDNQKLTLTGQLIGSPAYMAPELISGRPLDQRTDLFSLGILLYQLATGRLPFFGRNPHEVLNRIADGDYPPAASLCPLVDRDLEDIIALSLASDPDERYQSVETFGQELAHYLDEIEVEPTNAELARYFRAPEAYVVDLDERVCTTLTQRAHEAVGRGDTARAIRLLGRVLELDASHAGATVLLERLRKRERRNRRVLILGASVATFGLVFAAIQMIPQGDPVDQGQGPGSPSAATHDRADPDAGGLATPLEPSSGAEAAPALSSTTTETDDDAESSSTGGSTTSSISPVAGVTVTTTAAAHPPHDRVKKHRPSRIPETIACRIALTGLPLPTARNLDLLVGRRPYDIESLQVDVEFPGPFTVVRISDKRYTATRRITQADCEAGPVSVTIKPQAARVEFSGVPKDTVVVCTSGCSAQQQGRNQPVQRFVPVPIEEGNLRQPVTLVLKHRDYESKTIERDLSPGPNKIRVSLVPR